MITFSKLGQMGRISNQLFQCSAAIALALRNNDKYVFPPWQHEKDFNLHNCFSDNILIENTHKEKSFGYTPIEYKPNMSLEGFYQSSKYFEDFKDVILSKFTPKETFGMLEDTTACHVRRGDYIGNNAYEQLGMNYYNRAMDMIKSKYYYVFSDDIPWCKQNFKGNNITFIEGTSAVQDLSLMSSCTNLIMANSSFSFWGGFLNKNPDKIIAAPSRWFGAALSHHNTKDLYLSEWQIVDTRSN